MKRQIVLLGSSSLLLLITALAAVGLPMVDLSSLRTGGAAVLPLLLVAGLADGLNPCAFSTLLVFLGALLAYLNHKLADATEIAAVRRAAIGIGLSYVAGIFGVYFAAGLGLLGAVQIIPAAAVPWVIRSSGVLIILMGLIMVREYFVPDTKLRLSMPKAFYPLVRKWTRATTVGAAVIAGALIGLCSVPCSGAVYLGVLSVLALYGWTKGIGLLLIYNLAFVLPVLLLLFTLTSREALLQFTHWYLRYRSATKLALGLFVILLGLLVLWLP